MLLLNDRQRILLPLHKKINIVKIQKKKTNLAIDLSNERRLRRDGPGRCTHESQGIMHDGSQHKMIQKVVFVLEKQLSTAEWINSWCQCFSLSSDRQAQGE